MKKTLILSIALILNASEITNLFEAIKNTPDTKIDNVMVKQTKLIKKEVIGNLFPKVNLFASFEHFSSPANIRPLPPTKSKEIGMQGGGYWFSQNIKKVGFVATMPIFVKEIYDTKNKISHLILAQQYKAKLNLLKREALLVALVSKLNYLFELKKAVEQKQNSIQTTYNAIKVGVEVGRIPKFKLLRLKDALNQISIKITQINSLIDDVKSQIYQLTQIKINKPIHFDILSNINKQSFLALKPLKEQKEANYYEIKKQKDTFLPSFILKAQGYRAFANAYDNDKHLALNFASIGIYLNWNIFDKSQFSAIEKSKLEQLQTDLTIQKTLKDLNAEVMKITSTLKEIKKAILLTQNSIALKEELLKGAKTAFKLNTMTVDEYLEYEDDLANARANLANLIATKNTLIANLAFIYGNNLERIFK